MRTNTKLAIVMYHYIRDLPRTRFPRIKGLQTSQFEQQLAYISRHYTVFSIADVARAVSGDAELPANACMLTFDDGFIDHYETAFPRLLDLGMTASFFPAAVPVSESVVLDVHKVHFILAAEPDISRLNRDLLAVLEAYRPRADIPSNETLVDTYAEPGRFDPAETVFFKRVCQRGLPADVRSAVTTELFRRHVSRDEASFAGELYMSRHMLVEMIEAGMAIGGHGVSHQWLGSLPAEQQEEELVGTRRFLESIHGRPLSAWFMSYPHGSYNHDTVAILEAEGGVLGLTGDVGLADIGHPLELSRLNTRDLPSDRDSAPCHWTTQQLARTCENASSD
ncbi:polysaccharide deacetylase family protein [Candidatus Bipolaricaulota bacterium]|nr:polysaccharide deacetylase family protein [Candidatus Bipolaricaulota bacterium]